MSFGVIVNTSTAPPAKGTPTNTDTWFVVGPLGGDETEAHLCHSTTDYEATYGTRGVAGSTPAQELVWDCLDTFFREGGKEAYVTSYASGAEGWTAGLANFPKSLGPGQVSIIGDTYSQLMYSDLATHCQANNRFGLADVWGTNVHGMWLATLLSNGSMMPAEPLAEYIGLFGSWVNIPPQAGVSGASARTVPASPVIAALCARVDADGNPNRAAGGRDYPLQYVDSLVYDPLDADRATLFAAGVNTFRDVWGTLENYGFQTPVAQSIETPFWQANCSRARMWLVAQAAVKGENYYMRPLDANLHLATALGGDLDGIFLDLYNHDGLYGLTPADAFTVNVGVSVNNVNTAATASLNATAEAVLSLYAKSINIDLISVPVGGTILPA